MEVTIKNVLMDGVSILVQFDTQIGSGWAKWSTLTTHNPPQPGTTGFVEVDINDPIELGRNAEIMTYSDMAICGDSSILKLTGFVEDQEDDGLAYFRLCSDCLIMIEALDGELKGKCLQLRVPIREVELSPVGL